MTRVTITAGRHGSVVTLEEHIGETWRRVSECTGSFHTSSDMLALVCRHYFDGMVALRLSEEVTS